MQVRFTFIFDDRSDTMKKTFELGFGRSLIVDEFNLYRLHGRYSENSLCHASS
jgi:hypothetical protein